MAQMQKTYFTQRDMKNSLKLAEIIDKSLPEFCREYFIGIEPRTTSLTD